LAPYFSVVLKKLNNVLIVYLIYISSGEVLTSGKKRFYIFEVLGAFVFDPSQKMPEKTHSFENISEYHFLKKHII